MISKKLHPRRLSHSTDDFACVKAVVYSKLKGQNGLPYPSSYTFILIAVERLYLIEV